MKKLIFPLIFIFFCNYAESQVTQRWARSIPGNGYDAAIDGAGNIYVCGSSYGDYTDFTTIKYNSNGDMVWSRDVSFTDSIGTIEIARALEVDAYGNVYVTGHVWRNGRVGYDFLTIKYDSSGTELWSEFYTGPRGDDLAFSIGVDNSGNVFVAGYGKGIGSDYDYVTIKYDSNGTQLWVQRYNGPGNSADYVRSLALDGSGNVIVTGKSLGISSDWDFATLKYWSSGTLAWIKRYNGTVNGIDEAVEIETDVNNNVYVIGTSDGDDYKDIVTVKYSPTGTPFWVKRYDRPGGSTEWGKDIKVDFDANVYITGQSHFGGDLYDIVTVKYNSLGVQQWVRIYNAPKNNVDIPSRMTIDSAGNIYITGLSASGSSEDDWDYFTMKYNSDGIKKWGIEYDGPANYQDNARAIAVKKTVIVVTGNSRGSDYEFNFATVKYVQSTLSLTVQQKIESLIYQVVNLMNWSNLSQGNGNALNVKLNAALQKVNQGNNNAAINQLSAFNNQVDAFVRTNKLVPEYGETLIAEADDVMQGLGQGFSVQNNQPLSFALEQNYPNPFNPVTSIAFSLPAKTFVTITVYDILGKIVEILANDYLDAGAHTVDFDASSFASGVYFCRIDAGSFTDTKKMMLVK